MSWLCCCGGGGCFECDNYTGMADQFEAIVSGVTAGSSHASCTNANGTFTLDKTGGTCTVGSNGCCYESTDFEMPDPTDCVSTATDFHYAFGYVSSTQTWSLVLISTSLGFDLCSYTISCEDFDPLGDNTLSFNASQCCATWPSTVAVNAV